VLVFSAFSCGSNNPTKNIIVCEQLGRCVEPTPTETIKHTQVAPCNDPIACLGGSDSVGPNPYLEPDLDDNKVALCNDPIACLGGDREPKPVPKPIPKPVPKPIPKPIPKPVPKPIPKPIPKPGPNSGPNPSSIKSCAEDELNGDCDQFITEQEEDELVNSTAQDEEKPVVSEQTNEVERMNQARFEAEKFISDCQAGFNLIHLIGLERDIYFVPSNSSNLIVIKYDGKLYEFKRDKNIVINIAKKIVEIKPNSIYINSLHNHDGYKKLIELDKSSCKNEK